MEADDHETRDSVSTLVEAKRVADTLGDGETSKVTYYRMLASFALGAGYFQYGSKAANEAMRLLGPGTECDRVKAELLEATVLEGLWNPSQTESEGEK
jgi:hypothetical protein